MQEMTEHEEDSLFEVEEILAKRRLSGKIQYFVKYKGFGEECNDWHEEKELAFCHQALERFR